MGKTASQPRGHSSAIASTAIQYARTLRTTGTAIGTWFGYRRSTRAAQGHYDAERLIEYQAVIKRDVARLAASLIRPSHGYMVSLLAAAEQACLAPEQIETILRQTISLYGSRPNLAETLQAASERQRFRAGEAAAIRASVCLVTLGLPCVPWKIPNRWGLRTEADFSACFNPFALANHRLAAVIDALASDFADYCRPDEVMMIKSMRGKPVPARKDRTALWTHNTGTHWGRNNFAALVRNMDWKIANFRASCQRPNPVFLMSNLPDADLDKPPPFLPDLQRALRPHTGRHDNYIILTSQAASSNPNGLRRVDDTTFFLHCPYPVKGYAWNDDDNFNSPEGFAYERAYVGLICEALRQWGLHEHQRSGSGSAEG